MKQQIGPIPGRKGIHQVLLKVETRKNHEKGYYRVSCSMDGIPNLELAKKFSEWFNRHAEKGTYELAASILSL